MRIYGIDFTSRPRRSKPITCMECVLSGNRLEAVELTGWADFAGFEAALRRPGPWIAGIDFPFGQARRFIRNIGWPESWAGYVDHAAALGRGGFRAALDAYREPRPYGDKEHKRATDAAAASFSPQKTGRPPVGLMFFEGAPRLRTSGVTIPGLQQGDPARIVVEAYPGVLVRALIGQRSYKQDTKRKHTAEHMEARMALLRQLTGEAARARYGLQVSAPQSLADDPGGDSLDALLCAVQAAWAWTRRDDGFGMPAAFDPLEGWIADPSLLPTA